MADALDGLAKTGEVVAVQAAGGSVSALALLAMCIIGGLVALWIWRRTDGGGGNDGPDGGFCKAPPEGCPSIHALSGQVQTLIRQMEEDRKERHDHREHVEDVIRSVHSRIDQIFLNLGARGK